MMTLLPPPSRLLSRRQFLSLAALSAAGWATGCAVNPVTGRSQLMLVSRESEIRIDRQNAPHQFSVDYGPLQDKGLNAYIDQTGRKLAGLSHRPDMPYSFRGVNATYINAYAFPAGSIAATRGILLAIGSEAELAALLGHEIGHVAARHTAAQMSQGVLGNLLVAGASLYVEKGAGGGYGELTEKLGMIGSGLLLASYSRDNEREADRLGMEYMVGAGYSPQGMVQLMAMLRQQSKHKPTALELMFATHPMSDERFRLAAERVEGQYRSAGSLPLHRERYMDHTAGLRKIAKAIEAMQESDRAMAEKHYREAEKRLREALVVAPDDYTALVMMAKCQLAQENYAEAARYAELARASYPEEAQSYHLKGIAKILQREYDAAYQAFQTYERLLPGNPNTVYFMGLSLEGMGRIQGAASHYRRYLEQVQQGNRARHAYQRLVEWGYLRPPTNR